VAVKHLPAAVDITTININADFAQDWLLPVGLAAIDNKTPAAVITKLLADVR